MTAAQMLFGFEGRIRRGQYWLWSTAVAIAVAVIGGVELSVSGAIDGIADPGRLATAGVLAKPGWLAFYALTVGAYWIFLALEVKRWHDRGKSGLWSLICLVPMGAVWALLECGVFAGSRGPNRFGPSPRDSEPAPQKSRADCGVASRNSAESSDARGLVSGAVSVLASGRQAT